MRETQRLLTRRDFMRGTVGAVLAASVLGHPWASLSAAMPSTVHVVRDDTVLDEGLKVDAEVLQSMLDQSMLLITGETEVAAAWQAVFDSEDIVGVVGTPHLNPTHPELKEAISRSLIEFVGIPERNILDAQGRNGRPDRCSALINVPALKAHWLTGIGTVLKNYILYSGRPSAYHRENSAKLGEIWLRPEVKGKTRLVLVDALHPLCDKGPQPDPRYKWLYKGLISGTDPVAVETVCLKVITAKRNALRKEPWPLSPPPLCIEAADKAYGLGTSDMDKIRVQVRGWEQDLLL